MYVTVYQPARAATARDSCQTCTSAAGTESANHAMRLSPTILPIAQSPDLSHTFDRPFWARYLSMVMAHSVHGWVKMKSKGFAMHDREKKKKQARGQGG